MPADRRRKPRSRSEDRAPSVAPPLVAAATPPPESTPASPSVDAIAAVATSTPADAPAEAATSVPPTLEEPTTRDVRRVSSPRLAEPHPAEDEKSHPIEVRVDLYGGQLIDFSSPVAVVGRFEGLPLSGPAADFDTALCNWFKRAIEYGMISSRLGELTFLPVQELLPESRVRNVAMVGLGEPGRFSRDDLRYLFMNIVSAIKSLGHEGFSTALVNAPRFGLRTDRAVRAVFDGILDAYDRLRSITTHPGCRPPDSPLRLTLVEADRWRFEAISRTLRAMVGQNANLMLEVEIHDPPPLEPEADTSRSASPDDTAPEIPTVRLTVSSTREPDAGSEAEKSPSRPRPLVFQCSAVTDTAVIPVREQEVEPFFVDLLPDRMRNARTYADLEAYGLLLSTYLLPDEFLKLLDTDTPLTLIIDSATATLPWEMAAIRTNQTASFFGPDFLLTRQFRTLFSEAPGILPPLNNRLDVLVIADPAPDTPDHRLSLKGARQEGLAVVQSFLQAKQVWGDKLELNLFVRLGAATEGWTDVNVRDQLSRIPGMTDDVLDRARACDPLEILALLVRRHFDIVHYAGHGIFDPVSGRKGWVFNADCTFTAKEIFKVRRVPRLVFANACLSSAIDRSDDPLPPVTIQQAGLAEAFFARGVENYIGAAWKVDDALAVQLAKEFYLRALGLPLEGQAAGLAPPATLGAALGAARHHLLRHATRDRQISDPTNSWGAYQHYGQVNAKLLPFRNIDGDVDHTR